MLYSPAKAPCRTPAFREAALCPQRPFTATPIPTWTSTNSSPRTKSPPSWSGRRTPAWAASCWPARLLSPRHAASPWPTRIRCSTPGWASTRCTPTTRWTMRCTPGWKRWRGTTPGWSASPKWGWTICPNRPTTERRIRCFAPIFIWRKAWGCPSSFTRGNRTRRCSGCCGRRTPGKWAGRCTISRGIWRRRRLLLTAGFSFPWRGR